VFAQDADLPFMRLFELLGRDLFRPGCVLKNGVADSTCLAASYGSIM
jgi:hypothetical protein